jgi:hypothetical protein
MSTGAKLLDAGPVAPIELDDDVRRLLARFAQVLGAVAVLRPRRADAPDEGQRGVRLGRRIEGQRNLARP